MKKIIIVVLIISVIGVIGFFVVQKKPCLAGNCADKTPTPTVASDTLKYEKVLATEFQTKLQSTPDAFLLDVRTEEEFASGHIEGAVNKDYYKRAEFRRYIDTLEKDKTYFVYCNSGNRSASAIELMRSAGLKSVVELSGGILSWKDSNLPLVK